MVTDLPKIPHRLVDIYIVQPVLCHHCKFNHFIFDIRNDQKFSLKRLLEKFAFSNSAKFHYFFSKIDSLE